MTCTFMVHITQLRMYYSHFLKWCAHLILVCSTHLVYDKAHLVLLWYPS